MGVLRIKPIGKFRPVIGLDAFNGKGKALYAVLDELGRRIRVVFFKGFQITEAAIFVKESILVIISAVFLGLLGGSADQT